MARPTVLVVDAQERRRKDLVQGLAGVGYEVIAAANGDEGTRFATGLDSDVIVLDAALQPQVGPAMKRRAAEAGGEHEPPTCVVLAGEEVAGDEDNASEVRIPAAGLDTQEILRMLRTLLLGREVGIEPGALLGALVGDFQTLPLFDLLPLLQRAVVTGRLVIGDGELALRDGAVVAARAGEARGTKGFCRLARLAIGGFRLTLVPSALGSELDRDLLSLIAAAMEDQHRFEEASAALPEFASTVRFIMGPAFFATQFTSSQQAVLGAAHEGPTIWRLLDLVDLPDGALAQQIVELAKLGFLEFVDPEARVRIVTDSTCDLPREVALRNQIHVVPLSVIVGETIYKDGVDITPGAFYKLLQSKKQPYPRTSPPTMGEFLTSYRLVAGQHDLVSLHISEKMSQTVVNAKAAAAQGQAELQRARKEGVPTVEVVDSSQVSTGLALMAVLAARLAQRRLSPAEIRERIEAMRPRFHLLFVVDTLDYLARGGRIGKARAVLGGMLGIKPILGVVDGEVAPVDKVRGGKAAHPRIVELFKKRVDPSKPVIVGIGHASAPVWADRLRTLLLDNFNVTEVIEAEIGPVVGAHVGPGTVGAVMFQPTDEEAALLAPPGEATTPAR
jgi:DegV family protein with EDD domain